MAPSRQHQYLRYILSTLQSITALLKKCTRLLTNRIQQSMLPGKVLKTYLGGVNPWQ